MFTVQHIWVCSRESLRKLTQDFEGNIHAKHFRLRLKQFFCLRHKERLYINGMQLKTNKSNQKHRNLIIWGKKRTRTNNEALKYFDRQTTGILVFKLNKRRVCPAYHLFCLNFNIHT